MGTHKIHQQPAFLCKRRTFKSVKTKARHSPQGLVSTRDAWETAQPRSPPPAFAHATARSKSQEQAPTPFLAKLPQRTESSKVHGGRPGLAVPTELPSLTSSLKSINAWLHSITPLSVQAGHKASSEASRELSYCPIPTTTHQLTLTVLKTSGEGSLWC